jgi:hypothetical protein
VARDGVEPPTPAFSGLDTIIVISLIPLVLVAVFVTFRRFYWNVMERELERGKLASLSITRC